MLAAVQAAPAGSEAAAGLVLLVSGAALAPIAMLFARRLVPERNVHFARWGFSHVALVALVVLAGMLLSGTLVGNHVPETASAGAARASELSIGGAPVPAVALELLATVFLGLVAALAAGLVAERTMPEGWRALGFGRGRLLRSLAAGLQAYVLLLPLLLGLMMLWPWVLQQFGHSPAPQVVARELPLLSPGWRAMAVVLGVAVAPFLEELLFRGFLQPLLVQNLGETGGIVVTSALFAALHEEAAILPVFGLSLILGGVMLRTQRLLASWAVHALHNGLVMALLLNPATREHVLSALRLR